MSLTSFAVLPFMVVGTNTEIAIGLVMRYASSIVLTRPAATRGLQRQIIATQQQNNNNYHWTSYASLQVASEQRESKNIFFDD